MWCDISGNQIPGGTESNYPYPRNLCKTRNSAPDIIQILLIYFFLPMPKPPLFKSKGL